jgi:hypothetical protein
MKDTSEKISPLRRRMIEDMRMRKLSAKTQSGYIRAVRHFSGWLGRSPDTASAEDLRRYPSQHPEPQGVFFIHRRLLSQQYHGACPSSGPDANLKIPIVHRCR